MLNCASPESDKNASPFLSTVKQLHRLLRYTIMTCIETDVLIVGAGPAGASLGCFLTQYGEHCYGVSLLLDDAKTDKELSGVTGLIISKTSSTARTPRAHYTNNAAFGTSYMSSCSKRTGSNINNAECLRDAGLEQECRSAATPKELIKFYRFCHTMAGEEISRSYYAGNDPNREVS